MKPKDLNLNLEDLQLGPREIERLSGLEVSDRWVGGMLGGIYRFSKLQQLGDWLGWLLIEGVVASLLFVLTLPVGLIVLRVLGSESTPAMLASMAGATVAVELLWISHRQKRLRLLQTFLNLLDEIDRFHEVLNEVITLEQLQSVRGPSSALNHFETLQTTRDCLVAGLKTERILRGIGRRSQTKAGLEQLEQNLLTLEALSLQNQADEHSKFLSQALQISHSVQTELIKSYGSSPL